MPENKHNLSLIIPIPSPTNIYQLPKYVTNNLDIHDPFNPTPVIFYFPKNTHPPTDKYKRIQ